ncbi:MAG: tetratricopeptide repeat protein [Synechococcus sp.]|nr:tetratricopeptide repeat protein [Synechococcus sp.]
MAGRKRWWIGAGLAIALAVGWLLSELMHGRSSTSPGRVEVDRQVSALLKKRQHQTLSPKEERRLLERLLALGRVPESIVLVEDQLKAQPKSWRWRLLLSQLEFSNGNTAAAEAHLEQLSVLHPSDPDILQALARLRLQQGRNHEAIATVRAALTTSPSTQRLEVSLLLADLQRQSGATEAAFSTYRQLSKAFPQDPRPLMAQALLQQEQGQQNQALALLESARTKLVANGADTQALDALAARWSLRSNRLPSNADRLPSRESELPSP